MGILKKKDCVCLWWRRVVNKVPARFDDLLIIHTWCDEIKGPKIRLDYEMFRGEELLATGHTIHACVSAQGKVIRPFPELRRLLPE